jgi:hypothetical protein
MNRQVNIRALKRFSSKLPEGSILRDCLTNEPDTLNQLEFLGKIPVYIRLLNKELKTSSAAEIHRPIAGFKDSEKDRKKKGKGAGGNA